MSSKANASDPVSPRLMGAGLAMVGLVSLMVSSSPNWQSLGIALVCLLGFLVCLALPRPRPAPEDLRPAIPPAGVDELPSGDSALGVDGRRDGSPPANRGTNETHQALRATVRHRAVVRGS